MIAAMIENLSQEMNRLQYSLLSDSIVFHIKESEILLSNDDGLMDRTLFPGAICKDLLQYVISEDDQVVYFDVIYISYDVAK